MTNQRIILIALLAGAALASGCALEQMKQDNAAAEVRIQNKEAIYAQERENYRRLIVERDRIQGELNRSEYSAAQLRAQLDQMNRLNDATPSTTPQEKAAKARRSQQLTESQRQAQAVERDNSLSREQKQKQLNDLKARTKAMLDLLLQG